MNSYEVLRRPVVTEKNTAAAGHNKYTFEVAMNANKLQIGSAVERAFNVKVAAVNVMVVPGKMRRTGRQRGMTASWKKAVVTLEPGNKIELFQGV
jgi:large subunit ribosomal protein L23